MNQNLRDLIGGIFLVPALNIGFFLLGSPLMMFVKSDSIIATIIGAAFLFIGITQFIYLTPLMLKFRREGRFELVKGMSIGAIITIFLNSACFSLIAAASGELRNFILIVVITVMLMMMTFYLFNRRSRPK
jgi:Na+/proline symporter